MLFLRNIWEIRLGNTLFSVREKAIWKRWFPGLVNGSAGWMKSRISTVFLAMTQVQAGSLRRSVRMAANIWSFYTALTCSMKACMWKAWTEWSCCAQQFPQRFIYSKLGVGLWRAKETKGSRLFLISSIILKAFLPLIPYRVSLNKRLSFRGVKGKKKQESRIALGLLMNCWTAVDYSAPSARIFLLRGRFITKRRKLFIKGKGILR